MAQNDFSIANQGFPSFRSDLNDALQSLASNSAGDTEPPTTYAYQWWYDETNDILKIRNSANDAWIDFATFDQTTDTWSFASVTIDGDLTVDTDTLYVDSANNRVGIGTSSPDSNLTIEVPSLNTSEFRLGDADGRDLVIARSQFSADIGIPNAGGDLTFSTGGGSEAMRIDNIGNVGIGTSSPDEALTIQEGSVKTRMSLGTTEDHHTFANNGGTRYAGIGLLAASGDLYIEDDTGDSITFDRSKNHIKFETNSSEAMRIRGNGRVGIGTSSPSSTLDVNGSLSKNSGSFKIDHPVTPDTHHLVHSFVEGPQADNLYRGKVTLVDGLATVNLDEAGRMTEGTFVALNGNVQCWTTNEDGWTQVRGKVEGNTLTIEAQDLTCTDEVSWLVIGERHDQHMIETEWTDENGRVITEPAKENTQ